jgi:pimeloyl-ACP methyl ester carboxylesterase
VARIAGGKFEALMRLPAPVNVGAQDMYPHIAPDESYLVFESRRASPTPGSGLFVAFRNPDGAWGDPRPIDLGGLRGGLPFVSPDGKYLFFTAGERDKGDIYWVEAGFLRDRTTPAAQVGRDAPKPNPPQQQEYASVPAVEAPHFELMSDVGGRKLHACLYGKGTPTVVLVSGFNAPQAYWNAIIDPLAAEATVVTYDRAGVGESELGTLPAHARQSAVDLRRLLGALGAPKPWLLVGHSLGARIVKIFASMYPDDVGGLVLMDGVPANIIDEQRKILSGADLELLERMTSGRTAPANPRTEADFSLESLEQERTLGPLPRVPVLVLIAGDREKNVPPGFSPEARRKMAQLGMDLQKKMAADLGGTFVVFEGVGHGLHTEKPGPVAAAIKDMIRKLK